MRVHYPLFAALLLVNVSLKSQTCKTTILNDDFSSSTGWTTIGSNINITSGSCNFQGVSSSTDNRVYKNLNTILSNTYCKAECELLLLPNPSGRGAGAIAIALTAGPLDFMSYGLSQSYAETSQDGFGAVLYSTSATDNNVNNWSLVLENKKGNVRTVSPTAIFLQAAITKYYLRIERLSPGSTRLSVFSDAAFATHVAGSPATFNIDPSVTGLNTLQHGAITPGNASRYLNGSIDNSFVCDDGGVIATGIDGYTAKKASIAPNPFSSQATISLEEGIAIHSIQLLDITGKEVSADIMLQGTAAVINRQQLLSGVYFVKVLAENGAGYFEKIVIE